MAVLNLGQIRTHARLLALDASSTNPHHTDAEVNAIINEAAVWVWNFFGPRYELVPRDNDSQMTISGGAYNMTTAGIYDEIVAVFFENASTTGTQGTYLEPVEYHEIMRMREESAVAGTPKYAHWHRVQGTQNHVVFVHPIPAGTTYFSLLVKQQFSKNASGTITQALLSSDTDAPNVTPVESRLIARLAAYEMAALAGRGPDVLDNIAALVPDNIKAARGIKLHADVGVASVDVG